MRVVRVLPLPGSPNCLFVGFVLVLLLWVGSLSHLLHIQFYLSSFLIYYYTYTNRLFPIKSMTFSSCPAAFSPTFCQICDSRGTTIQFCLYLFWYCLLLLYILKAFQIQVHGALHTSPVPPLLPECFESAVENRHMLDRILQCSCLSLPAVI